MGMRGDGGVVDGDDDISNEQFQHLSFSPG